MQVFYCWFTSGLSLEIQLSGGEGCNPINIFYPATISTCLKAGHALRGLNYVQRFEVIGDSLFCCYGWIC